MLDSEKIKLLLGKPKNEITVNYLFGNTSQIISQILKNFKLWKEQTNSICGLFLGKTKKQTLQNIFYFLRENVKFIEDKIGVQDIKSPKQLVYSGFGDCKSFSLFIGSVLWCLNIPFYFRFVGYSPNSISHVFIICDNYILDCNFPEFNFTLPYQNKIDYMLSRVQSINGVNCAINSTEPVFNPNLVVQPRTDWTKILTTAVQVLPQVLNPTLAQNQNNPVSAQQLAQLVQTNQQALENYYLQQQQSIQPTPQPTNNNLLLLGALGFLAYQFLMQKKNGK